MAFNPTKEQEKAIETAGNILVAAAAGSGKTAVLVERVISKLVDKLAPVSADRLLIVTFTNAAAAEMRTRIEKRLDEECRKNPHDIGLLRQKHLLGSAKICTIDSFCIDLVRENFEKAGVSPDFKMSDGYALRPTNEAVLGGILNNWFESGDSLFNDLLDTVGAEYDEGNFSDFVMRIYNYSRQMPFPDEWFDSLADMYNGGKFCRESRWYQYAFSRADEIISGMQNDLAAATELITSVEKAADKFLPDFLLAGEKIHYLKSESDSGDWDRLYQALMNFSMPTLARSNAFSDVYEVKSAKVIWKNLSKDIEKLGKLFYAGTDFINTQFGRLEPQIRLLTDILKEFEVKLFDEYNRQNTFTFHNTEHLALSLLCSSENGSVTVKPGAEEFLGRFDEVMVDEYQDTNDLQDMLFYVLSDRESRLFVVGDVKQSIYGFRGANPNNFLNKKNHYKPIAEAKNDDPKKIVLGTNFRCHAQVCDFINYFFENLMTAETGNIVYDNDEKLISGAEFPETDEAAVRLDVIDCSCSEEARLTLEARHIADYIRKTVASGECIRADKDTLRRAGYSDFTILLRSVKNKASVIAAELRRQGIPVNFSTEGYAETVEIMTFLSLLTVIDNPKSDNELVCLMMSPIIGFTPDEMAEIRLAKRKGDFFSAVVFAAEQGNKRAEEFLKIIEDYRLQSVILTLPKLISRLLYESEYINIVSAMRDGQRRRNNLLMLCDYAEQFSSGNGGSIGSFVKYVLKQSENGMKSAAMTAGTDSVAIMSIHASKGLQFPVCIIADTATAFNDADSRNNTLYSPDYGIGFRYFDEELKTKLTTLSREVIIDDIRRKSLEEELRLLYVAMTRTQDRLFFTAAVSNAEKQFENIRSALIAGEGKIGSGTFRRTKSYAEWLLLTGMLHPDGRELRGNTVSVIPKETESHIEISVIDGSSVPDLSGKNTTETSGIDLQTADVIKANMRFVYPYEPLISIQAKSSVSMLANKAESEKYVFSGKPSFMSDGGITAAERGTAMHRIMEFIDFSKCDDIDGEIERLYEWQFITEREAEAVNRKALKAFFKSDIFRRIKASPSVSREMRFLTEIPAKRISPELDDAFSDECIIVQGAVDLCFCEDDGIVVLDFKTDRVDNLSSLSEAYGEQLSIYAVACEKLFGKKVKQKLIYSFALSAETEVR